MVTTLFHDHATAQLKRREFNRMPSHLESLLLRISPSSLKGLVKRKLIEMLRLQWTLRTGIQIALYSQSDWIIFQDIFTDGDYDAAIDLLRPKALAGGGTPINVLDLGANSGFFALRCADRLLSFRDDVDFNICSVEASPSNFSVLSRNLAMQTNSTGKFSCQLGAAGKRDGWALIAEEEYGCATRVSSHGRRVDYLDLDQLTEGWPRIDLIKCDIEGCEVQFLENYTSLLGKTDSIVIELHPELGVISEKCRQALRDAGFSNQRLLRHQSNGSTEELFCR
jgi:FkbM family methyltransferase